MYMYKLIEQYKTKLKDAEQEYENLKTKIKDQKENVAKSKKHIIAISLICLSATFLGATFGNFLLLVISLIGILAAIPFVVKTSYTEETIEENEKKLEELVIEIRSNKDEIDRLYSREEVLKLIKSKQKEINTNNPLQVNIQEKINTKSNIR